MSTAPKVEDNRSSLSASSLSTKYPGKLSTPVLNEYEPFAPLGDRILLRRVEEAQTNKLGVPDKYRQQTNKFEVLGVGELATTVKPGDHVLAGEYNAERFMDDDGQELWLVRIAMVRGVRRLKEPK